MFGAKTRGAGVGDGSAGVGGGSGYIGWLWSYVVVASGDDESKKHGTGSGISGANIASKILNYKVRVMGQNCPKNREKGWLFMKVDCGQVRSSDDSTTLQSNCLNFLKI